MGTLDGKMHTKRFHTLKELDQFFDLSEADLDLAMCLIERFGYLTVNVKDGAVFADIPHCRHTCLGFFQFKTHDPLMDDRLAEVHKQNLKGDRINGIPHLSN